MWSLTIRCSNNVPIVSKIARDHWRSVAQRTCKSSFCRSLVICAQTQSKTDGLLLKWLTNRRKDNTWSWTLCCSKDLEIVILPILSHVCSITVEHRQVFAQKTYQSSHWSQPIIGDPSSCLPHAGQIQTCAKKTILKSKYRKKPFTKNWIAPSPNKNNMVFRIWIAWAYFSKYMWIRI